MDRWIMFHDAELAGVSLEPGQVVVRVTGARTGLRDGTGDESVECDAVLVCTSVVKVVVDGFTEEYEYVSNLECRPASGAPFQILNDQGTTACTEVRITVWPTGGTFRIECSSVSLQLASPR